jgi:hypothetical protein
MDLENALGKINPDHGNFAHRTAPFFTVHTATALWHIAMPVVRAVHCKRGATRGLCDKNGEGLSSENGS